ncbi:MAG: 3'-5' exonuclease [Nitrospiraceae bacterium]|nr:MAG: 3'-5' exonuclease [Nitrospiraceae bacterium]
MMTSYKERLTGFFTKNRELTALSIENADYTVIDTELTGLDVKKDSIVSVGAIKMKGGRIDLGSLFYRLINPANGMNHDSVVIHGITPSEVAGKPAIDVVLSEFTDFCGSDIIVGHFISLDMNFIKKELGRAGRQTFSNSVVDTRGVYEWVKESTGEYSRHYAGKPQELDLFTLAREYGIPFSEGHNALSDAFITAQLFQRFLSMLPGLGVRSARDLLKIGKP